MPYEEALKRWAASKFDLPLEDIKSVSVDFRQGYGGGCDTCGWGADNGGLDIVVNMNKGKNFYKEFDSYDFPAILQEIVEAGIS